MTSRDKKLFHYQAPILILNKLHKLPIVQVRNVETENSLLVNVMTLALRKSPSIVILAKCSVFSAMCPECVFGRRKTLSQMVVYWAHFALAGGIFGILVIIKMSC